MKLLLTLSILCLSLCSFGQEVERNGKLYEVKKDRIFLDDKDVTDVLPEDDRSLIIKQAALISEKEVLTKQAKKLKKEQKKTEKAQKKLKKNKIARKRL
ncbi:hypothetical protein [Psychroserpens sp.]|uniref:hypothetical protein n=1 Tax=Psychroserpens sp. TaxID=2020870 RepID=UPI001B1317A9|nr:hypothetical protein [Psychroserpens sp.]MBO6605601.1 hypothetical protein [Psychroserpens sp.]MBO6632379.1 hypothetical protein [Psychroserpens sp.]MBO6653590.1 hypothetical protein [Psychroserpens sp.]MBO6681911.1 hypothetical protein [Psychroserpens sp.]MBO6748975.1 hypothetical protein [Psychroserpens sp.]